VSRINIHNKSWRCAIGGLIFPIAEQNRNRLGLVVRNKKNQHAIISVPAASVLFRSFHTQAKTLPTSFVRRRYPLGAFQVFSTPVYILLRTYNYHCLPPAAAASTIAFIFNTISFSLAFYSTSNRRNKKAMKTKKEEEVPLVKHVRPPFL
jgi:hypothetical protein